jgi:hypothetical protein
MLEANIVRFPLLAAGMLAIGLSTVAWGADYVLDVARLDATFHGKPDADDPPDALTTRRREIGIFTGKDFYNRVRIGNETVTVKGRLTEDKPGELRIRFSLKFQADVQDPRVRPGTKNVTSASSSQLKVVAGRAIQVGGLIGQSSTINAAGQRTVETTHDCVYICLDRPSSNTKSDARRRKRISEQYRKLLRQSLNSWLKKK